MAREIKVFLHNSYSHGELRECYGLNDDDADKVYDLLYEVALIVDLDTGKIVGVWEPPKKLSVEELLKKNTTS